MDRRLFPLSVEHFRREVEPLIAGLSGRDMTSFHSDLTNKCIKGNILSVVKKRALKMLWHC